MDPQDTEHQRILAALHEVLDPEIGENIVDLGLVERIDVAASRVLVTIVPTSVTCPMTDEIVEQASSVVQQLYPASEVRVEVDWNAQWTPQRMSETLRQAFGW